MSVADEPEGLLDVDETTRAGGWSLRSALVRYAQAWPGEASAILSLVRRSDAAVEEFRRRPEDLPDERPDLVEVIGHLSELGDVLASWAAERGAAPQDRIGELVRRVDRGLRAAGVGDETEWRGRRTGRGSG